jgi:hypothetical protein
MIASFLRSNRISALHHAFDNLKAVILLQSENNMGAELTPLRLAPVSVNMLRTISPFLLQLQVGIGTGDAYAQETVKNADIDCVVPTR